MSERWRRLLGMAVPYGLLLLVGTLTGLWLFSTVEGLATKDGFVLRTPHALWLGVPVAVAVWFGIQRYPKRAATFGFSRVDTLAKVRPGFLSWLTSTPRVLRVCALLLLVFALARPQAYVRQVREIEGIDIMLVVDLSRSMEETDIAPDRLTAARETLRTFLEGRDLVARKGGENDRVGLVVFAREAMLAAPLTLDYRTVMSVVANMKIGDVIPQGTAVGDALGLAIATLRRSEAESQVVILMTDGDSNVTSFMAPEEARELARARGVRVFTVLVGRNASDKEAGPAQDTNPDLLSEIADATGGAFFRAADAGALQRGFEEVRESLEKSRHRDVAMTYEELYPRFVKPALFFLLCEILLALTRYRRFP